MESKLVIVGKWVKSPVLKVVRGKRVQRLAIGLIVYLAVLGLVLSSVMPEKYHLEVGDIAPVDIVAPKDIVDREATQNLIEQAKRSVNTTYTRDHTIPIEVKNSIEKFFNIVFEVRSQKDLSLEEKLSRIKDSSNIVLDDKDYQVCLTVEEQQINHLKQNILDVTNQIMSVGVTPDALERSRREVKDFFNKLSLDQPLRDLGYNISIKVIKPNMLPNIEETKKDIDAAVSKVQPVVIKKGQNIVSRGERVTQSKIELLKASGLLGEGFIDMSLFSGYALLILVLEVLSALYLRYFHKDIYRNNSSLMLIGLIVIVVTFISIGSNIISSYLLPSAAASMLITILLDARVAIFINLPVAIIAALLAGESSIVVIFTVLIGGLVGVLKMMDSHQRRDLFISGLLVGVSNAFVITSAGLITGRGLLEVLRESSWGLLNGGFVAILTIGTLPIWENLFDIITPLKLLELSNPNQPLLKKLLLEAPGTYHHSIIVGNLAEYAAQEVGANSLLARVGAYYHDVGKIKRPYFFNENQISSDNPHDRLTPSLSTLIITSHVKDGVEMAKKYKIPAVVQDIIKQHHGDSVLTYFYHKAREGENGDKVTKDCFCYEGPKPQTKEAAIVMLADSVEAAVRSMTDHSPGKMEGQIRKIIKDKLDSGQLDESDLTLKDLDTIAGAFLSVLSGIFHQRIEYPDINEELKGGQSKNDGSHRE